VGEFNFRVHEGVAQRINWAH